MQRSDEGEYTCRAQNDAGTQEASAVLYVRDQVRSSWLSVEQAIFVLQLVVEVSNVSGFFDRCPAIDKYCK